MEEEERGFGRMTAAISLADATACSAAARRTRLREDDRCDGGGLGSVFAGGVVFKRLLAEIHGGGAGALRRRAFCHNRGVNRRGLFEVAKSAIYCRNCSYGFNGRFVN
jgi:hypothetical protein